MVQELQQHHSEGPCHPSEDVGAITAVSLQEGLVDYAILPKSIKTEEFQAFLRQLSAGFDNQPFAIYLDNLSVHKTNLSRDLFADLQITPIFNVPYSPQCNGIERFLSLLKNEYKNLLIRVIMKGEPADVVGLIKLAISKTQSLIDWCCGE